MRVRECEREKRKEREGEERMARRESVSMCLMLGVCGGRGSRLARPPDRVATSVACLRGQARAGGTHAREREGRGCLFFVWRPKN